MYIESQSILDVLFGKKGNRFITIVIIVAIALLFIYVQAYFESNPREDFIAAQSIEVFANEDGVQYGSTDDYYYALLPDFYLFTEKQAACAGFVMNNFTSWCGAGTITQQYK